MRRQVLVLMVLTCLVVGGGASSHADTPTPRRSIEIACGRDGARIVRDVGDAGAKGVTVRFRHPAGRWSFFYDGAPKNWSSWGADMVAELQLPIPPGPARIQCTPSDEDVDQHDARWWVHARVEDPRGVWRSPRLDCSSVLGTSWHGGRRPAEQEREVVLEAMGRVLRIQPSDTLQLVGYPRQIPRLWGMYRDGRLVAVTHMMPPGRDGTVAPNGMTGCSD